MNGAGAVLRTHSFIPAEQLMGKCVLGRTKMRVHNVRGPRFFKISRFSFQRHTKIRKKRQVLLGTRVGATKGEVG